VECGGGKRTLRRNILVEPSSLGNGCPLLEDEEACNQQPCPVDCVQDEWSGWSYCSRDCEGGIQQRSRNTLREEQYGGRACDSSTDARQCNTQACDKPCDLGEWSEWDNCSKPHHSQSTVKHKVYHKPGCCTAGRRCWSRTLALHTVLLSKCFSISVVSLPHNPYCSSSSPTIRPAHNQLGMVAGCTPPHPRAVDIRFQGKKVLLIYSVSMSVSPLRTPHYTPKAPTQTQSYLNFCV
jgi:hypothetical protein